MDSIYVSLPVITVNDYFNQDGKKIDWEETQDSELVPLDEAHAVQRILTCEISYYLLRRAAGVCGSLVDDMWHMRLEQIKSYEETFHKIYVQHNDLSEF